MQKELIIIRNATQNDISQILILEEQLFPFDSWTADMFEHFYNNAMANFVVAMLNNTVVGYMCIHFIDDFAELENLAVCATMHRCGIGKALLQYAIQSAQNQGAQHIFLEVATTNTAAIELYKSFNFTPLRIRKNYYTYGDAIELRFSFA